MAPTLPKIRELSEQEALNSIAFGVAGLRSTDLAVADVKGATLALSVTDAAKAVPEGARGVAFWCATSFRYRFDAAADLTDGAYADANDKQIVTFDPSGTVPAPATLHAVLSASTDTLYINWLFGE